MIRAFLLSAALACSAIAHAETIVIQNGKVVTNTTVGVLENADVVLVDGRIRAVGVDLPVPRGARVIDAAGSWVTPGIFAAMSQVGLNEISGSGAPNDAEVEDDGLSAAVDAGLAFNPTATAIAVTRIEGVTRLAIAPNATGSLFSGQGALVSMSGQPESLFRPRAFQVLQIGEEGARRVGGSRAALWPSLQAALRDAREYPQRYTSGQGGAILDEVDAAALKPYALGQAQFVVEVERAVDIRALLTFAAANPRLRFVIHGGAEAWQVAGELAAANIPVILDPFANLPDRFERLSARLDNAALLHAAGVRIAIAPGPGSVDAHQSRLVLQLAGNAVANGLPWEAAFAAVTSGPADIYGVGRELGRLAPGAIADVVVWDGDPLEVMSAPTAVFIDGRDIPLVSRQTRLRDRYTPVR
ncbi:MAG: amidohydrolase family protein [Caulobacterales bacterium]